MNTQPEQAQYCNPSIAELQKKAHLYMIAVASAPPSLGKCCLSLLFSFSLSLSLSLSLVPYLSLVLSFCFPLSLSASLSHSVSLSLSLSLIDLIYRIFPRKCCTILCGVRLDETSYWYVSSFYYSRMMISSFHSRATIFCFILV